MGHGVNFPVTSWSPTEVQNWFYYRYDYLPEVDYVDGFLRVEIPEDVAAIELGRLLEEEIPPIRSGEEESNI